MKLLAIPEIFIQSSQMQESLILPDVDSNTRWAEFIAHLSQFSDLPIPDTKFQLEELLDYQSKPGNKAAIMTGIARCSIGQGRLFEGAQMLGQAYSNLSQHDNDIRAFILLEMVSFLAIIGSYDNALMLLQMASSLTNSKYLLKIAKYYGLINVGRKGDQFVIDELKLSAEYFKEINQQSTLAYHYKNIGNFYRLLNDFENTQYFYNAALEITKEKMYKHIRAAIYHDIGILRFRENKFDEAIDFLHKTKEIAESYYTKSSAIGNIGFLYYQKEKFTESINYFQEALEIQTNNGVFNLVPGSCLYLGSCHEKLGQLNRANFYYEKGSQLALELTRRKFPLKGELQTVINKYISFLQDHQNENLNDEYNYDFSFAIDKTLKEIRAVFQNLLLDINLHQVGTVRKTCKKLDIAESTYVKARNRNKKIFLDVVPESLKLFVTHNDSLSWKEINRKYDDHIFTYLYHQYDLNKKRLSSELDINYTQLVTRFKQIDQTISAKVSSSLSYDLK
jgi:tetratricopeptide (TPR) repeat protein